MVHPIFTWARGPPPRPWSAAAPGALWKQSFINGFPVMTDHSVFFFCFPTKALNQRPQNNGPCNGLMCGGQRPNVRWNTMNKDQLVPRHARACVLFPQTTAVARGAGRRHPLPAECSRSRHTDGGEFCRWRDADAPPTLNMDLCQSGPCARALQPRKKYTDGARQ
eukprot:gene10784-biopygen21342